MQYLKTEPPQIPQEWMRAGTDVPKHRGDESFLAWHCPPAHAHALLCTFGGQKVDQHSRGGDEDTGHDDVDDVEERLALDDEVKDDLLVLDVIWGELLGIDDLPSRAVLDFPFAILCRTAVPCESHCPTGSTGAAAPWPVGGGRVGW